MVKEGFKNLYGNKGYQLLKIPQNILNEIKDVVDEIQQDFSKAQPYNHSLEGHIDNEYVTYLPLKTKKYIEYATHQYCINNPLHFEEIENLFCEGGGGFIYNGHCWVNFQKKHEYNPIHLHHGIFSYVIWYQIPFYKENEIKYGAGKNDKTNKNGEFEFVYPIGETVNTHMMGVDKNMEGYIAIFPSKLQHIVYPFYTSDDYRITISGNIYLK